MRSVLLTALLAFAATAAVAADAPPAPAGTMNRIVVHGDSLAGNLEGDPADRTVFVYLPPGLHHGESTPAIRCSMTCTATA